MGLKEIKDEFYQARRQFTLVSEDGKVQESDDALFPLPKGSALQAHHPFFESILPLLEAKEELQLNCVHLGTDDQLICDVEIKNHEGFSLLIFIDFTEHYAELQKVTQTRNESVIAKQFLDLQNQLLKEKEEFKNKFIANFSHEIRNPLTSILTFSQMLKHTELSNDQLDYANVIQNSTVDLKNLLEDIMDMSKIETGKFSLDPQPFDLKELLKEVESTYNKEFANKGLSFVLKQGSDFPDILEGDRMRLKQVLVNLLNNALKFTKKGGVEVYIEQNYKRGNRVNIHFSVSDTGMGIKDEDISRIFESFTQLNNSDHKGVGLGLSITKEILNLMGSELKVESTYGKGTRFTFNVNFNFPIHKVTKSTTPKSIRSTSEKTISKPKRNEKIKALLIEDSEMTQMVMLKILVSTGEFYVEIFNGEDGVLEDLKHNVYDIIFMDIKLEGETSGDELAKKIRRLGYNNTRTVPIIAVTAYHKPKDLSRYKRNGITDTVRKPFDEDALLKTAYQYLS